MTPAILTLNAGSSSLKFRVFARDGLTLLARGAVSRIGADPELRVAVKGRPETSRALPPGTGHEGALQAVLDVAAGEDANWRITAVAHRVVHGGSDYVAPVVVTPGILADLRALVPLAPLHQPHNLAAIEAAARLTSGAPQIACFDTAFHAGRAPETTHFALPREYFERGVRRYGFHGLSYEWLSHRLAEDRPDLAAGRVIAAHLGNGASLCAMREGRSIDTTMGMTAVDGVPMGTRSGALDPGAILLMIRSFGMTPEDVEELIYNRSGLRGVSGLTNDVAALLEDGGEAAAFALSLFCHRVAQAAAGLAVSLGGVDAMIFTGGIGENAAPVRQAIIGHLRVLGRFETLVIPADEERMMAVHA
ncbi:MAG: acetate/propionate family kinase, partial [Paracoccus sp. (in: a-proteobacteria)]|nr:acetate/propionate family kinase [Paracoccus sp. (in: a-proteobacteria)]